MFKRIISLFIASFLLLTSSAPVFAVSTSETSSQMQSSRLAGQTRYDTSAEITKTGWTKSDYAVIASGETFPDALCGAPLAKKYNAPILLTAKDTLDEQSKAQLIRLMVKNVFVIGGTGVISLTVEQQLQGMGIQVTRIAGNDRYETSLKVAQAMGTFTHAVVATGENFPDALSIAPVAAMKGMPILLTPKDNLSIDLKNYLNTNTQSTYVVGGTGVVSDNVLSQLPSPKRLSGLTRYDTNVKIIEEFANDLDFTTCYIATGENFPDALAGSALASLTKAPLILVNNPVEQVTKDFINTKVGVIKKVTAFGGVFVVPENTLISIKCNFTNSGAAVMNDNVKLIDVASQKAVWSQISKVNYTQTGTQFILNNTQSELSNLTQGDIFYLKPTTTSPLGYAGKVVSITDTTDNQKVMTVVQPKLTDMFSEMNFDIQTPLSQGNLVATDLPAGCTMNFVTSASSSASFMRIQSIDTAALTGPDIKFGFKSKLDLDGNPDVDTAELDVDGDITLQNPTVTAGIEFYRIPYLNWPYSMKKASAHLTTTELDNIDVKVGVQKKLSAADLRKTLGQRSNEVSLGKDIKIKGVDMDDKIILGNATFALGSVPVQFKPGEPLENIPLGAAILLTATLSGDISATVDLNFQNKTLNDMGLTVVDNALKIDNSSISENPATTFTASVAADVKLGFGPDLTIITLGIVPAEIGATLLFDTSITGEGVIKNWKDIDGSLKGEATVKLESEASAGISLQVKDAEYGDVCSAQVVDKVIAGPYKFGISSESDFQGGNITNGGYVVKQGDWLYFTNGKSVYKQNTVTKSPKQVIYTNPSSHAYLGFLNADSDYLYFQDGTYDSQTISKMSLTDNSQVQTLDKGLNSASDLALTNGSLYYLTTNNQITTVKTDGSGKKVISAYDKCTNLNVSGDSLYYLNAVDAVKYKWGYYGGPEDQVASLGKIYKINLETWEKNAITSAGVSSFCVNQDWIYYSNGDDGGSVGSEGDEWYTGKLYKVRTSGTDNQKIIDSLVQSINATDMGIYFQDFAEHKMAFVNADGSNYTQLFKFVYTSGPNVIGNEVFCLDLYGQEYTTKYTSNSTSGNELYSKVLN